MSTKFSRYMVAATLILSCKQSVKPSVYIRSHNDKKKLSSTTLRLTTVRGEITTTNLNISSIRFSTRTCFNTFRM